MSLVLIVLGMTLIVVWLTLALHSERTWNGE